MSRDARDDAALAALISWLREDGSDSDNHVDPGTGGGKNVYIEGYFDLGRSAVEVLLAADDCDEKAGTHRVRLDQSTTNRVASLLGDIYGSTDTAAAEAIIHAIQEPS